MITSDMPLRKQNFFYPEYTWIFSDIVTSADRMEICDSRFDCRVPYGGSYYWNFRNYRFLDGFIARKFNMITNLGKIVDPVADKLTQAAIVFSLSLRFQWLIPVVVLFVIKEGVMGIMGVILLKKGKMLNGAKWFGKVSTAVLYVVMFILILAPNIQEQIANMLIVLSGFLLLMSFILYIPVYKKILSEA